ncbi:MAG: rod shape-determining protein MreD [Thainema sp.]
MRWKNPSTWNPATRQVMYGIITVLSVLLCLLVLPLRLPGVELLGVAPNWLLIWVVAWSLRRSLWQGAIAGVALGLIQDGMTAPVPTHALSLAVVGILTSRIQKQRYIQEDFISVALIVFGMAVVAETVVAMQYSFQTFGLEFQSAPTDAIELDLEGQTSGRTLSEIWIYHQQVALSSAILSSLWAPALYYPLRRWWERLAPLETN